MIHPKNWDMLWTSQKWDMFGPSTLMPISKCSNPKSYVILHFVIWRFLLTTMDRWSTHFINLFGDLHCLGLIFRLFLTLPHSFELCCVHYYIYTGVLELIIKFCGFYWKNKKKKKFIKKKKKSNYELEKHIRLLNEVKI